MSLNRFNRSNCISSIRLWIGAAFVSLSMAGMLHAIPPAPPSRNAQQRPSRFQPNRPTISPYLNLFRNDNSAAPNYHLYVRPEQQQRALNDEQQRQNQDDRRQVKRLDQELRQVQAPAAPTGISAGFGNYLHFYPALQR